MKTIKSIILIFAIFFCMSFLCSCGTKEVAGPQGPQGVKGEIENGISSIKLTNTEGLVDTYTIYFTDGTTTTFNVTNGKDGAQGIQGEPGKDGHTPVITIANGYWYIDGVNTKVSATGPKGETGNGISSIEKTATNGVVDTYTITYTDGTTSIFTVVNGNDGVDGKTPYIGGNGNWWIGQEDTGVTAEIQEDKYLIPNTLDNNYFEGKTIVCIGDSITAGVGTTVGVNDYVTLLGEKLGANTVRKGVSGTVLCTDGQRKCNIDMLTKENINGADIVTIFMGINDWANATKNFYSLGTLGSDDTSTIYGAVGMWCRRIKELQELEEFKDTKFYFMTPVITSWNNSVTSAKSWDQTKTNICGYTLRDLCEAIIETSSLYKIPVLDLNYYSGIYYISSEDNNVSETGGDGVHPSPKGHSYIADAIAIFLLDNPTYVNSKEAIEYLLKNEDASKSYIYSGREWLIRKPEKDTSLEEHVHVFTEWDYIKEPTITKKGIVLRFCEECSYTETNYVEELGFSELTFTAFGDSITYGADLIIGGRVDNPYPTVLSEILGFEEYENKGISGATLTTNDQGLTCMTDVITSYTSKTDIIGVLGGVNDYNRNLPLGDIDDNDTSTIYGSLHVSMSYLSENYSDAFVFYMTPYKEYFHGVLWSDINSQGYNLEDVANAIKEVAEIYNIPVLDLLEEGDFESIMYNDDCDGIHPNQEFITNVMAPQIANFIKDNYQ